MLSTGGCAHIMDPLPPHTNIPARILDLAAVQRGSHIIAQFSVPVRTTEGIPIHEALTLELRAGPSVDPFDRDRWLAQAEEVKGMQQQGGYARYEVPAAAWAGKEVVLAARATGSNGKDAGWSNYAIVHVVAPPAPPQLEEPVATAQGVRLAWTGSPGDFRVWRRAAGESGFSRMADLSEESWLDTTAEFGKAYTWEVQRVEKLEGGKEAESDASNSQSLTPIDKFPPAVPSGLHASLAAGSIELTWQQNMESDLGGYVVYRAEGNGPLTRLAQVSEIPSYSDHSVEAGKTYRYAVSAIDRSGNESDRSMLIELSMQ